MAAGLPTGDEAAREGVREGGSTQKGRNASATSKPWRSLALILIAIVALTGGMFASGHTTPRLGIDLVSGTSITLAAVPEAGQESAINKTNMDTAVSIMERRVNGLGVSEAEVQTQGDRNIIVNIPKGTNSKQAREQVGTTAKLYFRPVIATELAEGGAAPQPSATGEPSAAPPATRPTTKPATRGTRRRTARARRPPTAPPRPPTPRRAPPPRAARSPTP